MRPQTEYQLPANSYAQVALKRLISATGALFQRPREGIQGLEVSDSTWEAWEAATRPTPAEAGNFVSCADRT